MFNTDGPRPERQDPAEIRRPSLTHSDVPYRGACPLKGSDFYRTSTAGALSESPRWPVDGARSASRHRRASCTGPMPARVRTASAWRHADGAGPRSTLGPYAREVLWPRRQRLSRASATNLRRLASSERRRRTVDRATVLHLDEVPCGHRPVTPGIDADVDHPPAGSILSHGRSYVGNLVDPFVATSSAPRCHCVRICPNPYVRVGLLYPIHPDARPTNRGPKANR